MIIKINGMGADTELSPALAFGQAREAEGARSITPWL